MNELLLELICCKNGGASKKEIVEIMRKFDVSLFEIERLISRVHYARNRSDSFSIILLNENKKWYTFDNKEYCLIVLQCLTENPIKPIFKPSKIPSWAYERYELFFEIFGSSDFI